VEYGEGERKGGDSYATLGKKDSIWGYLETKLRCMRIEKLEKRKSSTKKANKIEYN